MTRACAPGAGGSCYMWGRGAEAGARVPAVGEGLADTLQDQLSWGPVGRADENLRSPARPGAVSGFSPGQWGLRVGGRGVPSAALRSSEGRLRPRGNLGAARGSAGMVGAHSHREASPVGL